MNLDRDQRDRERHEGVEMTICNGIMGKVREGIDSSAKRRSGGILHENIEVLLTLCFPQYLDNILMRESLKQLHFILQQ